MVLAFGKVHLVSHGMTNYRYSVVVDAGAQRILYFQSAYTILSTTFTFWHIQFSALPVNSHFANAYLWTRLVADHSQDGFPI